jgi:hypothetical protein
MMEGKDNRDVSWSWVDVDWYLHSMDALNFRY